MKTKASLLTLRGCFSKAKRVYIQTMISFRRIGHTVYFSKYKPNSIANILQHQSEFNSTPRKCYLLPFFSTYAPTCTYKIVGNTKIFQTIELPPFFPFSITHFKMYFCIRSRYLATVFFLLSILKAFYVTCFLHFAFAI